MKIAIDAMGGDSAPANLIQGAKHALEEFPQVCPVLVGDSQKIRLEMDKINFPPERAEIVHASQVISMADKPVSALRGKKDSSITVALNLHRMGKVQAVVGAGNTGAQVAASMIKLGRVSGVIRPVIGSFIPTTAGYCLLLDVGANTDCHAIHLFQFGIMASILVKEVLGYQNPRIGLLSIGAEKSKGNEVSLFAYHLFEKSHLNFIGNIEGSDLLAGKADVAVCDGFVGNLLLKFAESFPPFLASKLDLSDNGSKCAEMKDYLSTLNPDLYGGVPILGVNGISIVCHGASSPRAITSAIKTAIEMSAKNINAIIARELSEIHRFYRMNRYFASLKTRWTTRKHRLPKSSKRFFTWFSEKSDSK